jgi:Penicillin-insensitive murein endopeptidase
MYGHVNARHDPHRRFKDPIVTRILVDAAIKKTMCREARSDRFWLSKVRRCAACKHTVGARKSLDKKAMPTFASLANCYIRATTRQFTLGSNVFKLKALPPIGSAVDCSNRGLVRFANALVSNQ